MLTPKQVVEKWVVAFNNTDISSLRELYHANAINHQVNTHPLHGQDAIIKMFSDEFALADMVCIVENIFEDKNWAILEWKDPLGLRGSSFFDIENEKIIFQRGYYDKLTFLRQHGLPLPTE
ncbi:MAG: ester cyclase [Ferruginibacter sp.]